MGMSLYLQDGFERSAFTEDHIHCLRDVAYYVFIRGSWDSAGEAEI